MAAGGLRGPAGPAGAQGPAGSAGPQGLQGIQGIAGPTGAQGPEGPQGPAGQDGLSASSIGIDWPRFILDGTGYTPETIITKANAANLATPSRWPKTVAHGLLAQPAVANGLVYYGDKNGTMYASAVAGDLGDGWTQSGLGIPGGIWSTPLIEDVRIAGELVDRSVLFIGGGGDDASEHTKLFALDALTGDIIWQTSLSAPPGARVWASPVSHNGFIYIGVASVDDSPLVQGIIVKVAMGTGTIAATLKLVPDGSTGACTWGSVTFDTDGTFFVATGNEGDGPGQELALAILHVDANLAVLDSWRNTGAEGADLDFGATPTLFETTTGTKLVGIGNKDGNFYVLDRTDLAAGPVATLAIAVGGANPTAGDGVISPAAWNGGQLFVAGGNTTIDGTPYGGSVRCYDPDDFTTPIWEHGFAGHIVDAITAARGIIVIGAGTHLYVLDAADGSQLFDATSIGGQSFLAAAVISGGVIYAISTNFGASHVMAYTPLETLLPPPIDDDSGLGGGGGSGAPLTGLLRPDGLGLKALNMRLEAVASATYAFVDGYLFLQKLQFADTTITAAGISAFCGAPAAPTKLIASLWDLSGTTATLIEEIDDAHVLFGDYLQHEVPFAAPHDVTGDILVGYYCTGGSMPQTMRASGTNFGEGKGPGIDKRANTFVFLGSVSSMPSTIDLASCGALNEWPTAGLV